VRKKLLKKGRISRGTVGGPPAAKVPAGQPEERTDEEAKAVHERLLEKARKGGIDVYFEGDSIVRRWAGADYPELLAHWNRTFQGLRAANFGCGADKLQNILWRLNNGELDGVNPKVVVLLAGTNDVGDTVQARLRRGLADKRTGGRVGMVEDILKGFKAILNVLRAKAQQSVIIVTGIFPRNDDMEMIPLIFKINKRLSKLADGKKILYLDVNGKLADKKGKLFEGMTQDQVHPTLKGYQAWADGLKPMLAGLLGNRVSGLH
jgi:lysophospholipase L1-like esterase